MKPDGMKPGGMKSGSWEPGGWEEGRHAPMRNVDRNGPGPLSGGPNRGGSNRGEPSGGGRRRSFKGRRGHKGRGGDAGARGTGPFEFVVEGIPVSANNDRPAARQWKARVGTAAACYLRGWGFRDTGELSALMVLFHTGPYACDTDNIPKHVLDALTGVVFDDDDRVTQVVVRRTRQLPGLEIIDPPPLVATHLGLCSHFLYVRIEDGPDHSAMPRGAID